MYRTFAGVDNFAYSEVDDAFIAPDRVQEWAMFQDWLAAGNKPEVVADEPAPRAAPRAAPGLPADRRK